MKRFVGGSAVLILACLVSLPGYAEDTLSEGAPARSIAHPASPVSASRLNSQVREIADSPSLSRAKKEKRIANAVRVAVVAATAYRGGPEALDAALNLATAAARGAPQYGKVIADAVSFSPAISRIDGSAGQIAAAIASGGRHSRSLPARSRTPAPEAEVVEYTPPPTRSKSPPPVARTRTPVVPNELPESEAEVAGLATSPSRPDTIAETDSAENSPQEVRRPRWTAPEIAVGENASVHLNATISLRHDNNIYLKKTDKVSDQILSFVPGFDAQFGQRSLTHGSLSAQEDFRRYLEKHAPNAHLASANAAFAFGNDNLAVSTTGAYQQLYQSNTDVAARGNSVYRSNTSAFGGNVESHFSPKLGVSAGVDYAGTDYKTSGLSSNHNVAFPVKFYYSATPKLDLFTGVTYRTNTVDSSADSAKDFYYNVGARGSFTPKLSGQVSAGYKTRTLGDNHNDATLGFDGSLNYELTPKTSSGLAISRGFSTSALGESLTSTRYAINFTTDFTEQWKGTIGLSHSTVDYGTYFDGKTQNSNLLRTDNYWEGNLAATYVFSHWLSLSADFTLRSNSSNLAAAEFSNDLVTLIVGLRY